MREGVAFNPRYEACGFHPEETVRRRRDLTDGQKWLYHRLVGWARPNAGERPNERAGEVWRSCQNIAAELGKSEKQIGRDLAKLEAAGLIGHHKRDGRKSNTYFFRFHHHRRQDGRIHRRGCGPAVTRHSATARLRLRPAASRTRGRQ